MMYHGCIKDDICSAANAVKKMTLEIAPRCQFLTNGVQFFGFLFLLNCHEDHRKL